MRRSVSAALITLFALSPAAAGEPAPPDPSTRSAPGEESPTLGRLVSIPAGTFTMGSPSSEPGRSPDEGQVSVTLTTGFLLMETEVTQRQWRAVMGNNPSKSAPCRAFDAESLVGDDRPVSCVSWWDAVAFANKVSTRARLTPAYRVNGDTVTWDRAANGYRLPTEAE